MGAEGADSGVRGIERAGRAVGGDVGHVLVPTRRSPGAAGRAGEQPLREDAQAYEGATIHPVTRVRLARV